MNTDFKLVSDTAKVPIKGEKGSFKIEAIIRVTYKDTSLAKWQGENEEELRDAALKYISAHGYLAEWYRRWKLKQFEPNTEWVQWNDSLFVDIA